MAGDERDRSAILVVEDDEAVANLLVMFLESQGYDVAAARDKAAGIDRLDDRVFDLIVVDKNLPDGSGLDVIREANDRGHGSESLVVTGYSDLDSAIQSVELGVFRYIRKPFDMDSMLMDVTRAIEARAIRKRLERRTRDLEVAHNALRESEHRFRELVQLLPDIVYEMDDEGKFTFWNDRAFENTGYTREDLEAGLHAWDIVVPEDRERTERNVEKLLAGRAPSDREYMMLRKDGTSFEAVGRAARIVRDGGTVGLLGFLVDITDLKDAERSLRETEEQLRQAQKMEAIGRLAGGVAHDFNNLLGAIRGYADTILHEMPRSHPVYGDVGDIAVAADKAADLTRQLLAFGRKQVFKPRVLDVNEVVEGMERILRRVLGEDVTLVIRLAEGLPAVEVDPGQIEQVIMNLSVNGREAMPAGGILVLGTGLADLDAEYAARHVGVTPGRHVFLAVTDDGAGMDEETRNRVFEPFFTTKEKGTGLGLSTVYGIVKQSGGGIWAYSEPGSGSTFKVYLPAVDAEAQPSLGPAPVAPLGGDETILLVEDEELLRRPLARGLRMHGYEVAEASCAEEALRICERSEGGIDLLLTDVVMPDMSGLELASRIAQSRPGTKVLLMSGYSDEMMTARGMLEEGVDFIQKPFSIAAVAAKVRDALDGRGE